MSDDFDPYYEWLGIPPKDQPPNHYRLLGIEIFESNLNVVERAADRQMAHVRTYQSGKHSKESQRLLNELSAAKVCLLNESRRADYDQQLRDQFTTQNDLRLTISGGIPALPIELDEQIPTPLVAIPVIQSAEPMVAIAVPAGHGTNAKSRRAKPAPSRNLALIGAAVAVIVVGIAGFVFMKGKSKSPAIVPANSKPASISSDPAIPVVTSPSVVTSSSSPVTAPPSKPPVEASPTALPTLTRAPFTGSFVSEAQGEASVVVPSEALAGHIDSAKQAIRESNGIVNDKFAFCQTLPWDQFLPVHDAMRKSGYRLSRFRPYPRSGNVDIAAIWLRDGLPFRVVAPTQSNEVEAADATLKRQGFHPVDICAMQFNGAEFYGGVWVKLVQPAGVTQLTLGILAAEYQTPKETKVADGFSSAVHLAHFDTNGERRYSDVWVRAPQRTLKTNFWTGDIAYAKNMLARSEIHGDVSLTVNPKNGEVRYFGTNLTPGSDTMEFLLDTKAADLGAATEQFALENMLPASLSVAVLPSGETVATTTWRPDGNLNTPVELAAATPASSPSTMPTGAPTARALRFDGQSSVVTQDSVGLADIRDDFTAEMWLKFNDDALGTANILFGTAAYKGLHPQVADVTMRGWLVGIKPARAGTNASSQFIMQWADARGGALNHTGDLPGFDGDWHHFAICNKASGGGWELVAFVDGREAIRASHTDAKDSPSPVGFYLGRPGFVPTSRPSLKGLVRAFRLSRGIRYAAEFKPDARFTSDADTLIQLDFNGESPQRVTDLAANRHGTINGAMWADASATQSSAPLVTTSPNPRSFGADNVSKKEKPPADTDAAIARVRETFKLELAAAKARPELAELSGRMTKQAADEPDRAVQFALYAEARRLAIDAGDWNATAQAIDELAKQFEVDVWALRTEAMVGLAKKTRVLQEKADLAEIAITQAEAAQVESAYDAAEALLTSASGLAPRTEKELGKRVSEIRKRVTEEKRAWQPTREARAKLAQAPDDPAANELLGKYLCFHKDDWMTGLPHLTKSGNAALAALAKQDAQNPTAASDQLAVADLWADWAKTATASDKLGGQARALHWYQATAPQLRGLDQTRANKAIEDLSKSVGQRGKNNFAWLNGEPGLAFELNGHTDAVTCLAISRTGRMLVSGARDDTVRMWDLATQKPIGSPVNVGRDDVRAMLLSPDDRAVAIPQFRSENGIGVWSLVNGQQLGLLPTDGNAGLLVGSADWKRVLWAKQTNTPNNLLVYDLSTMSPVTPLTSAVTPRAAAVSRTGRYFAIIDDNNLVHLLDTRTGKAAQPLTGHNDTIMAQVFSPNEKLLATAAQQTIILWDLATGKEATRIAVSNFVYALAFSPDGNRLLAASNSNEITILSARDGQVVGQLRTNAGTVNSANGLVVSPDGRAAASCGFNSPIRVWRLPQ